MPRFFLTAYLELALVIGSSTIAARAAADDLARELPRIPPKSLDASLRSCSIHASLRLEPVAAEPLVTDPVSACFDADGRLYVVEMRGYPYPEQTPSGNVTLLDDIDGDGRFDKSTIFLDGLSWPTSVVPYDGGAYIAVAPDILYAKDTDGDGRADIRKVVFTGFGTQNVQALVNGLLWGPDGWIYGVSAANGGEITNVARPGARPVSIRGRDFRFRPDASAFEPASGGGQFGHSFDDWGHRFTCNNSNHIRQIVLPARYLERNLALAVPAVIADIAAEGPAAPVFRTSAPEPWRVVRTRQRAADAKVRNRLPPTELVAAGFFTSATGVTIYRGTALPPEFRGNAFIGDVGGNLVHRKILTQNGAVFRAVRADENREFLTSSDNWFRPVNFANTPSGTLLIVDMYRETIEHPLSIPDPIKKHLDLKSGNDRGRLYEVVPAGFKRRGRPALSRAPLSALVKALADPDAWWRETAQRLLIERKDAAAIPLLKQMVKERPGPLGRVHALWTLDVLGALKSDDLTLPLVDPEARVREQAARLAENFGPEIKPLAWARLAYDDDPMVRFQTALSAGALDGGRALDVLRVIALTDAGDDWARQAVMSALDAQTSSALLFLLSKEPGFVDHAPGNVWLGELGTLIGARNDPDEVREALAIFTDPPTRRDGQSLTSIVLGLGRGLERAGGSFWSAVTGPGLASLKQLFEQAAQSAGLDGPIAARIDATRLLALGPPTLALSTLPALLDARQPAPVQLAALQAMARLHDPAVGLRLIARWRAIGPSVKREAIEVLFARPEWTMSLLDAIEKREVSPTEIDPIRRTMLLASTNAQIKARATALIASAPITSRAGVLASYRVALGLDGRREPGRAVFKKACATCHKAEGAGNDVGPDLATTAGRTPEDLLVQIIDPNREVAPQYVNYTVATADGRVMTGLIVAESASAITLKRAEGATDIVPRGQIEQVASTGLSLMPEGLEKALEPQDLADLIAFIRGQKSAAASVTER